MAERSRLERDERNALGTLLRSQLAGVGVVSESQLETIRESEERDLQIARRRKNAKLRAASGVYSDFAFADLNDDSVIQRVAPEILDDYRRVIRSLRKLLTEPGTVVLRGDVGPGKTHLASALVYAFCDEARPAYYTTGTDFFADLCSTFGEPGKTQRDMLKRYEDYDFLAIDEYEVRPDNAWHEQMLRNLVSKRDANGKSTVLITNFTFEAIQSYLPRAMLDRIGLLVECEWPSLRPLLREFRNEVRS